MKFVWLSYEDNILISLQIYWKLHPVSVNDTSIRRIRLIYLQTPLCGTCPKLHSLLCGVNSYHAVCTVIIESRTYPLTSPSCVKQPCGNFAQHFFLSQ